MTLAASRFWPGLEQVSEHWWVSRDGDVFAASIVRRHYSRRHYADGRMDDPTYRNRNLMIGPGQKILLVADGPAVFAWRKFIDNAVNIVDGTRQIGVNNCIFRREGGDVLASDLIKEANVVAWRRWPGERLYTYVDPVAVRSRNPGYCYIVAGYKPCGWTKSGKRILECVQATKESI